jgi:glucosyl-dolichyl phosphate glucuronosyltransferase
MKEPIESEGRCDVSIAICTWNRSKLLEKTLSKLTELIVPSSLKWEVVVVDNNSTDNSREVIESFQSSLPIRYVFEKTQGHCYARNRAIQEVQGDLILWTDDDVLVDKRWLATYYQAYHSSNEGIAFWGGTVTPWFEVPLNESYAQAFPAVKNGFCGITAKDDEEVDPHGRELPMGANFAVRTEIARRVRFDTAFGKVGNSQFSGEDHQFLMQIQSSGLRGRWVPGATVQHYVCPSRLKFWSILYYYFELGRTVTRLQGPTVVPMTLNMPRWMIRKWLTSLASTCKSAICCQRIALYRSLSTLFQTTGCLIESRKLIAKR